MSVFVKFLVVGGVSAALNALSRMGFSRMFSLEVAVCLAYGVGMVCAYGLSRVFVFDQSGRSMRSEFVRFAIVNAFALLVVLGVTMFLARVAFPFIGFTWQAETVAHLAGILAPVLTSYLGHKHFTFEPKVKSI